MYIYDEYLENESILHMNMQIRNEKGHKYRDRKNDKITRQDTQDAVRSVQLNKNCPMPNNSVMSLDTFSCVEVDGDSVLTITCT